jgi:hypothetical protein
MASVIFEGIREKKKEKQSITGDKPPAATTIPKERGYHITSKYMLKGGFWLARGAAFTT